MLKSINQAVKILREGGIIIYPTEGVYGLGCDPFNETAVLRLLKIKKRSIKKGLILIAANWEQVKDLVKIDLKRCSVLRKSNYPTTWVFPATKKVPHWIIGKFKSVAIRVISHPVAKKLCQKFGGPIVSTSANLAGEEPIKKLKQLDKMTLDVQVFCKQPKQIGPAYGTPYCAKRNTGDLLRRHPFGKVDPVEKLEHRVVAYVDFILQSPVGNLGKPTKICDIKTGKIFRI